VANVKIPSIPTGFEYLARRADRRQALADAMRARAITPGEGQQTALSPLINIAHALLANRVEGQARRAEEEYGQGIRELHAEESSRFQDALNSNPNITSTELATMFPNPTNPLVQALIAKRIEAEAKRMENDVTLDGTQEVLLPGSQNPVMQQTFKSGRTEILPGVRTARPFVQAGGAAVDAITANPIAQLPQDPNDVVIRGQPAPGQLLGNPIINQPKLAAETQLASARRPVTSNKFEVQTLSTLGRVVPTAQVKILEEGFIQGQEYAKTLPALQEAANILKDGKLFSGFAAKTRLDAARFADLVGLGGKSNAEKIANSQQYVMRMGALVFPILKALRPASDTDYKTAQAMVGGELSLSLDAMRSAVNAAQKEMAEQAKRQNAIVDKFKDTYKSNPEVADALEGFRLPDYYSQKPAASARPPGMTDAQYRAYLKYSGQQ
jgi:hypothetical protein